MTKKRLLLFTLIVFIAIIGIVAYTQFSNRIIATFLQNLKNDIKSARNRPGIIYGDDLPFEMGDITISDSGWNYEDSSECMRLSEEYNLSLKRGDGVILTSENFDYKIGIHTVDGQWKFTDWMNGADGYVVPDDGEYTIVIKHYSTFSEEYQDSIIQSISGRLKIFDNHNEDGKTHLFRDDNVYTSGHASGGSASSSPQDIPENSIQGAEYYASQGYWGVECDVRLSSDGDWILCHDSTVDRTTDHTGYVHDYTIDELKTFRLKKNYNQTEYTMPTIYEWLDACKRVNIIPVIEIEFDGSFVFEEHVKKIVDALIERDMEKDAVIISFNYEPLYWVKKYCREIETMPILNEFPDMNDQYIVDQAFEQLAVYGNTGVFINQNSKTIPLTAEYSACAHSYGLSVGTWTSYPSTRANTVLMLSYDLNLCGAEVCPNVLDLLPY